MAGFSDIPIRTNGTDVTYAWFNAIRTALINYFGSGSIQETQVVIANNTGSADVTGALVDGSTYASCLFEYYVRRVTSTLEYVESGSYRGVYKATAGTWDFTHMGGVGNAETEFTMANDGQIQSTTSDMSGSSYVGNVRFKLTTFNEVS